MQEELLKFTRAFKAIADEKLHVVDFNYYASFTISAGVLGILTFYVSELYYQNVLRVRFDVDTLDVIKVGIIIDGKTVVDVAYLSDVFMEKEFKEGELCKYKTQILLENTDTTNDHDISIVVESEAIEIPLYRKIENLFKKV